MNETRHSDRSDDREARRNYLVFCAAATLAMAALVTAAIAWIQ